MFVRMTFNKDDPAAVEVAIAMYTSEEVSGVVRRQKGHQFHYLLRSADRPHAERLRDRVGQPGGRRSLRAQRRLPGNSWGSSTTYHTEPSRLRSYEDLGVEQGRKRDPERIVPRPFCLRS
jgi:hypothetical protein